MGHRDPGLLPRQRADEGPHLASTVGRSTLNRLCCLGPSLTSASPQERALTTVMYLMSLAELAQAPFALVDEINQGMDQRVERNVHNALVKTTCKDDVGQ